MFMCMLSGIYRQGNIWKSAQYLCAYFHQIFVASDVSDCPQTVGCINGAGKGANWIENWHRATEEESIKIDCAFSSDSGSRRSNNLHTSDAAAKKQEGQFLLLLW